MEYNINDKVVVNWSIFGGETPLFGAAFHIGFLVGLFIFDTAISKHWERYIVKKYRNVEILKCNNT